LAQIKLGDYYRSKEALGSDLQRLVVAMKSYIPSTEVNNRLLVDAYETITELFFDEPVVNAKKSSYDLPAYCLKK
jgi:hypothetical protein